MDEARKAAFRQILYSAMLEMRAHRPVSSLDERSMLRWLKFPACFRRVRELQDLADALHNLALFAARDFDHFDEAWFWKDMARLEQRHPGLGSWVQQIRQSVGRE